MKSRIVLLSGVHGVGKGYFSDYVLKRKGLYVVTASDLIGEYKKADDAGYKKVLDINENQQFLLYALWKEKKVHNKIILDGHLTLINAEDQIQRISETFVKSVPLDGIVLLQDDPSNIVERQAKRDNVALEKKILEEMQKEEVNYCHELYENYHIPYIVLDINATLEQFSKIFSLIEVK